MDPLALVLLAPLAVITLAAVMIRRRLGPPPRRSGLDYGAMADVEEHDIDQMIDELNERRRRRGARDVGEELSDELLRGTWR